MEFAQTFADDLGALAGRPVRREAHLVHAEKNAAMHGFQTVADVGKSAPHDHAHRVIEVRTLHFVFDVDGHHDAAARVGSLARIARRGWAVVRWRGRWWALCGI